MKSTLTVQDIRDIKQKLSKSQPDSDRSFLYQLTEIVELMYLKSDAQQKEIDALKKDLKKAERNLTHEINRVSSSIRKNGKTV